MKLLLALSLFTSLTAFAQEYPGSQYDDFDTDYSQSDEREQDVEAASDIYQPLEAIKDIADGQLIFRGKMLMTGSISVKSCIFENQHAIIVYNNCTKKEAPATSINILSKSGGMMSFSIENSARMEARGTISTLKRDSYDRNWMVSFKPIEAPAANITNTELDSLISKTIGACYIGGMMVNSANPKCFSEASSYSQDWAQPAISFWNEPGDVWYKFLKDMRLKVSTLPQ